MAALAMGCGPAETELDVTPSASTALGVGLTGLYSARVSACWGHHGTCSAEHEASWGVSVSDPERAELEHRSDAGLNAKRFTLKGLAVGSAELRVEAGENGFEHLGTFEILEPDGGEVRMKDARQFDAGHLHVDLSSAPVFIDSEIVLDQAHTAGGRELHGHAPFEVSGTSPPQALIGPSFELAGPVHWRLHTGSQPGLLVLDAAAARAEIEVLGAADVEEIEVCDGQRCNLPSERVLAGRKKSFDVSAKFAGERVLGTGIAPVATLIAGSELISIELGLKPDTLRPANFRLVIEGLAVGDARVRVAYGSAVHELDVHVVE